ncbi:hypothetical protein LCGC14_3072380, partial [marine sediment metagenome]
MTYQCEYCSATFNKDYTMYRHQRTAKYCLAVQDKQTGDHECTFCSKIFSRKDNMLRHQKLCSEGGTKTHTIKSRQLEDQIEDLKQIIAKLVDRPANVNTNTNTNNRNNVVMNLQPITDEEIADHLENLTLDFIQEGAKGYAAFANNYPFKDRLLCTDKARKKLRYKDNDGELIEDGGGLKLTQRFFQIIAPRNEELINAEYRALQEEVQQIADAGTGSTSNLTGLLTKATHLQDLLVKCQQAARGEENEFTKEFV